jgi:hypothetical protein
MNPPRVAFFTDSFHEVNGVALTSREFARFARDRGYPFLSVHAGYAQLSHAVETNTMTRAARDSRIRTPALRPATKYPTPRG